ncbi:Membrane-bound lytic murein transglycosylase C precursor [compost metagenome]
MLESIQNDISLQMGGISSASVTSIGKDIESLIIEASQKYGVPASLIKAVIETESSFNPQAVSKVGAKGLMQLMDGTARGLGVTNSFDPAQNIDGGTRYLANNIKRFGGDVNTALAAYNAGPGRLQKLGITNDQQLMEKLHLLPLETQNYIAKIANAQAKYEV